MTPAKAAEDPMRSASTTGQPDRLPDDAAAGTPARLLADLTALLPPGRVLSRVSDLVRYASDASPYRLVPQAVVVAHDVSDVSAVLKYAHGSGRSVVFRAGGSSLSGQSQTDDILVDVRRQWVGVTCTDPRGRTVRVRPGTTVAAVNLSLKRFGRIIGPDPASKAVACVGGVVANNASGMAAGTAYNSYATVRSMTLVLPNGAVVDTAAPGAEERFAQVAPDLAVGLARLRVEVHADPELVARLRRKYAIKNTTGYRLDAFLDGETPLEIYRRLMVGSEGTLGFIAEVEFDTIPFGRLHATSLLVFPSLEAAAHAVPRFVASGARAVEMMEGRALLVAASRPGAPGWWQSVPESAACLLVEYRAPDEDTLADRCESAKQFVAELDLVRPAEFTTDDKLAQLYWWVRTGMMSVGAKARPPGSTVIVEDVCVPPQRIAEASRDVMALQERHGYPVGVAGHASAGNLHFQLALDSTSEADRTRYQAFMNAIVDLIVDKYDGSLKAEHGTGRNMAPFVEREWGPVATRIMWRVKELADPAGVLAPGVLLNRDPAANMAYLKTMPQIDEAADTCFECGFCEQTCPSRDLTTTPRQRIVLRREMARQPDESPVRRALVEQYAYDAVDTCAGDSTCALACPVGIDTGALMKSDRAAGHGPMSERAALALARHWVVAQKAARVALAVGGTVGDRAMGRLTGALRLVVDDEVMPRWSEALPAAAPARLPVTPSADVAALYYPACVNRIFGHSRRGSRDLALPEALVALSDRAGLPLRIPESVADTCCATVWQSKGYTAGNAYMARLVADRLWEWTEQGRLPVVVDASSCSLGLAHEILPHLDADRRARHERVEVLDSTAWLARHVLPHVEIRRTVPSAVVHGTCSMSHLDLHADLVAVTRAVAQEVIVPDAMGCCAFAGDRGLLKPELADSATAREAAEVRAADAAAHVSANRTCEIGLEQATGQPYESVVLLLEWATRSGAGAG